MEIQVFGQVDFLHPAGADLLQVFVVGEGFAGHASAIDLTNPIIFLG